MMRLRFVAFLLLVVACDAPKPNGQPAPSASCKRFGDTCEVSPGKLGTCVQKKDDCVSDCFVCQSQH